MPTLKPLFLVSAVGLASPLLAGTTYEAQIEYQRQGMGQPETYTIRGWVDGQQARVEMDNHHSFTPDSYLLTADGGKTAKMVDTEAQFYFTYIMPSDPSAGLAALTGGAMKSTPPEVEIEILADVPGEPMLGHPTRRVDWKAGYQVDFAAVAGQPMARYEIAGISWLADDVDASDHSMWLWTEDLNQFLASMHESRGGFPLRVTVRATRFTPAGPEVSTLSARMTRLATGQAIDASLFAIPGNFTEMTLPGFPGLE